MSTKPIVLLEHESKALAAGKLGVLIRPFDNPPPEDMSPTSFRGPKMYHPTVEDDEGMEGPGEAVFGIYDDFGEWGCACPFGPPGTTLAGREEWSENDDFRYAADGRFLVSPDGSESVEIEGFEPADTMPDNLIRFRPVVSEVRCVQLQSITVQDVRAWGVSLTDGLTSTDAYAEAQEQLCAHLGVRGNPWLWLATINTKTGESK